MGWPVLAAPAMKAGRLRCAYYLPRTAKS